MIFSPKRTPLGSISGGAMLVFTLQMPSKKEEEEEFLACS
jgi:hypothetical protein